MFRYINIAMDYKKVIILKKKPNILNLLHDTSIIVETAKKVNRDHRTILKEIVNINCIRKEKTYLKKRLKKQKKR